MNETAIPIRLPDPEAALSRAQREYIMAQVAEVAEPLIGVFDAHSFTVLYLNEAGRGWLNPEGAAKFFTFSLHDLIGVRCLDQFRGEIVTHARVTGKWSGDCDVRDVWGSETPARFTLVYVSATAETPACFCVNAIRRPGHASANNIYDRELLHALLESVPDAIYFKDAQSRFLRVSRAMARKMGIADPVGLIGKTDFDCFTPEHAEPAFTDERRIIATGEPILDHEEKETWPSGHVTWVSTSKFPLRDCEGRTVGTFGVSRDITGRKIAEADRLEMETKLQLAQKLESIGQLAAGIAHEINTPTQYITDNVRFVTDAFQAVAGVICKRREALRTATSGGGNLETACREIAAAESAQELDFYLKEIPATLGQTSEGLARITRIVHSLKDFSHPNNAHRGSADLNHAIETAIAVSRHEWKYVAEIETQLDPLLPAVPCVLDEFNQVMLNLIINAAHAVEAALKERGSERGKITIRTAFNEREAIVEVADTGTGIAPEHRARIFEPFFTTKAPGRGTGQGLGIVHAVIVKRHQGSIDFRTEVGVGTTFRVTLPLRAPNEGDAS